MEPLLLSRVLVWILSAHRVGRIDGACLEGAATVNVSQTHTVMAYTSKHIQKSTPQLASRRDRPFALVPLTLPPIYNLSLNLTVFFCKCARACLSLHPEHTPFLEKRKGNNKRARHSRIDPHVAQWFSEPHKVCRGRRSSSVRRFASTSCVRLLILPRNELFERPLLFLHPHVCIQACLPVFSVRTALLATHTSHFSTHEGGWEEC